MRARYYCENCAVRDRSLCSVVSEEAAIELRRIAHHRRIPFGQVVQSEHQGLNWIAIVVSGVVKLVKAQKDGRQQIVGLQFPGDFIGRPFSQGNALIAEATTKLELCCFSKSTFEDLMQKHPCVENALLKRALDDLDTSREWMFLLGRKTAREKVASLLASIAGRFKETDSEPERDLAPLKFDLPLSRNEIADALGLTIETVSREIRFLKSNGLIATVGRRHMAVFQMSALNAIAEGDSV